MKVFYHSEPCRSQARHATPRSLIGAGRVSKARIFHSRTRHAQTPRRDEARRIATYRDMARHEKFFTTACATGEPKVSLKRSDVCYNSLILLASPTGFEPVTPRLGIWCSILLSYEDRNFH